MSMLQSNISSCSRFTFQTVFLDPILEPDTDESCILEYYTLQCSFVNEMQQDAGRMPVFDAEGGATRRQLYKCNTGAL